MSARTPAVAVTDPGNAIVVTAIDVLSRSDHATARAGEPDASAARILIAGGVTPVTGALLDGLPALEVVVRTGAGYDHVDLAALRVRGLALVAPRLPADRSVAEYVFGAAIFLLRGFREADAAARRGDFQHRFSAVAEGLEGKHIGIVGVGRIGKQVARMAPAFGLEPSVWHPWSDRPLGIPRHDTMEQLLRMSDIVTLHCRLTDETRGLVGAAAVEAMRPGALLVNTARGGIVDEAALAAALHAGRLGGAAIDTFADEPAIGASPLQTAPRTLLTPHCAGLTRRSVDRLATFVSETASGYLRTEALPAVHTVLHRP